MVCYYFSLLREGGEIAAITVREGVRQEVVLLARAWSTSEGDAVARLVEHFRTCGSDSQRADSTTDNEQTVPIHAVYNGSRIDAAFDPATEAVKIVQGQLAGRTFKSPSGAAVALVQEMNPRVNPNRNGWSFWTISSSGETLQTIR